MYWPKNARDPPYEVIKAEVTLEFCVVCFPRIDCVFVLFDLPALKLRQEI